MKIYIGADHNGYEYKDLLSKGLQQAGHEVIDEGNQSISADDDFPQFATAVTTAVLADPDKTARGILICASGQGMVMAANRYKGIRASLCWNQNEARAARNDDDSNVLCLSSHYTSIDEAAAIMATWLATPFAAEPSFVRRIQQLDELP